MASLVLDQDQRTSAATKTVCVAIETTELWEQAQAALRALPVRVVMEQRDLRNWPALLERLELLRPEVVLLDITHLPHTLEECVRSVRASAPDAMLMVLHSSADPGTILAAVRAGAHEFLYPPLENDLRKALGRKVDDRARLRDRDNARPPGKVIGFLAVKGGCGASTIACHLAAELGQISVQRSESALLADLDLESGIVGFLMKVKSPYSLLDAVQNLHRLDLSYWSALVYSGWPGLEIIGAPGGYLPKDTVAGEPLRQVLAFARSNYAWTVADLGCTPNLAIVTALDEVDELYLVTTLEVPALHQAKQTIRTLTDAGHGGRLRVILNRTPQRPDVSAEELERILGLPIDTTLPNDYYALYDAFCKGKLLPSGSHLSRQIAAFAMRLAGVPAEKGKRRFGLFG
jgi:pilus assembly protein CpaE